MRRACFACSPAEVRLKLRFVTEVLGAPVGRAVLSPRALLQASVTDRIGPRFAFVKARGAVRNNLNPRKMLPHAAKLAPSTLLKSCDEARNLRCRGAQCLGGNLADVLEHACRYACGVAVDWFHGASCMCTLSHVHSGVQNAHYTCF